MGVGATAIVVAFAVEFDIDWSFFGILFVAWQTLPLILAGLLLRERVMRPLAAIAATASAVSLILLEFWTTDWESSSTAAIGILFTPVLPVLAVSLCLLLQVGGASVAARIRRNFSNP